MSDVDNTSAREPMQNAPAAARTTEATTAVPGKRLPTTRLSSASPGGAAGAGLPRASSVQRKTTSGTQTTSAGPSGPGEQWWQVAIRPDLNREPVQHRGDGGSAAVQLDTGSGVDAPGAIVQASVEGLQGSATTLPHQDKIQQSFGNHDVSSVQAHVGGAARSANEKMGSRGYASGNSVAFREQPDLHTAAHEAAHVVQQRSGISLENGLGQSGDQHERHADAVADSVVQGKSAEGLLDQYGGASAGSGVQMSSVQFEGDEDAPSAEDKSRVRNKVTKWTDQVTDFSLSLARWNSRNWTKFISSCGGNYYVAWSQGQFQNAVAAVISTGLGLAFGSATVLGALIGTSVAPGVGTVVGAIVGFLASLIIGGIMTAMSNDAAMKAVDKTLRGAGTAINEKNDEFNAQFDKAKTGTRKERDNAYQGVDAAGSKAALAKWETWVDGETAKVATPINTKDTSLYQKLLRDWVLQHSGDEEDENKETNSASFDKNRKEAFGLDANANMARKDLFIHQCKYEWGRLGVDYEWAIDLLKKKYASWQYTNASQVASNTKYGFHMDGFKWTSTKNSKQTLAKIKSDWEASGWGRTGSDSQPTIHPTAQQQIRNNDFELECRLDMTSSDGAAYIDEYEYKIDLKKDMPRPYVRVGSWTVSPD